MVFDAWVYGELELPTSHFSSWLSQPLGAEAQGPDFVADDSGCVGKEPLIILEGLHQLELTPREFLGVAADTGRVRVRGLLNDEGVLSSQGLLTGLFASAAGHGGDGRMVVVGRRGTHFAYEVVVCCGAVRARALNEVERSAFLASRACAELMELERANAEVARAIPEPEITAPRGARSPLSRERAADVQAPVVS